LGVVRRGMQRGGEAHCVVCGGGGCALRGLRRWGLRSAWLAEVGARRSAWLAEVGAALCVACGGGGEALCVACGGGGGALCVACGGGGWPGMVSPVNVRHPFGVKKGGGWGGLGGVSGATCRGGCGRRSRR
jgi:hypothetical protein